MEVPRESDEDNDEDGSNPEETVAEISGAGEHPPGEEMYGEVGSRVSVDFPIDVSKEDSSKTKKKKKKKQRSAEVDSDDSDENSESTTNTTEKKKHDTSSKKKKKKSSEDMDASKNKNTVSKKKSGKKDDGEPVRVRRSRRNKKWRFHFCLQQIEARLIAHMESAEVEDIDSQEYEFEFGQLVHLWKSWW